MAPLRLYHVDVFAERPFAGNPLAVVLDGESLSAGAMQTIARELKLSETAFVLPAREGAYRLRIFTPAAELPFAGHPTVGAAWLLARLGRIPAGASSPFEVEAGLLATTPGTDGPTWVRAPSPQPLATQPEGLADALLPALGLERGDLLGPEPELWSTGNHHAVVLLAPGTDLAAVTPDQGRIAALLQHATCYVAVVQGPGKAWVRVFVPALGVPEDPATGSGAAALTGALAARHPEGLADGAVEIRQGAEMGQPSVLHARQDPAEGAATIEGVPPETETWIGGTCHLLYETDLAAPPDDAV
jgi:trans-2,3-dihydro-3-hydroxyanthranilate isomerase